MLALIEPFPEPLVILHVKVADGAVDKNAVNITCCPTGTLAVPGKICTGPAVAGGGVAGGVTVWLPHAAKNRTATSDAPKAPALLPILIPYQPSYLELN